MIKNESQPLFYFIGLSIASRTRHHPRHTPHERCISKPYCMSYYSIPSTSTTSITPVPSPRPNSPIMAEPQPAEVHEGAADPHAPTGTAEDRKATAALSTLDVQEESGAKEVASSALDKAMKGLGVKDKNGEEKKTVKVEAADVNLLVGRLLPGVVALMLEANHIVGLRARSLEAKSN